MSHLSFSINLFKLKNCAVANLTSSRTGESKKCLIIPIEDNSLTVTEKGVYLPMVAFESDKLEKQSHLIKQSFKKEILDKMTEEEKYELPILGGISKPIAHTPKSDVNYTPEGSTESEPAPVDDIPF